MADNKPSFFSSVTSGIKGFFKGIVAGGVVGAITGGLIGAVVAAFTFNPLAIVVGAMVGGAIFAPIGSIAGTTTEVVKSRQKIHAVSGQDVLNAVNIAFAQGVSVGHTRTIQNPVEAAQESANFRKMVEDRRIAEEAAKQR